MPTLSQLNKTILEQEIQRTHYELPEVVQRHLTEARNHSASLTIAERKHQQKCGKGDLIYSTLMVIFNRFPKPTRFEIKTLNAIFLSRGGIKKMIGKSESKQPVSDWRIMGYCLNKVDERVLRSILLEAYEPLLGVFEHLNRSGDQNAFLEDSESESDDDEETEAGAEVDPHGGTRTVSAVSSSSSSP